MSARKAYYHVLPPDFSAIAPFCPKLKYCLTTKLHKLIILDMITQLQVNKM